ncbi:methyltransferase domain-containing protein [Kribbella capetownensis]|uniref:Methyltransferase domain-containing protein n=1 Tax=Kribbella capetownensis TaxID=1572659 RepID=A0A4V2M6I2_9ACTN|nr:methyltransferase domain-containing protein [Kribbella capetownensis]TCC43812.1 methyltransferase domain-containing protein [Kribbella capetownensis]
MSGTSSPGRIITPGLDQHVTDRLVLRTLDGAADLLMEELRALPSVHSIRQLSTVAVECTVDGRLSEIAACSLYSTVAIAFHGDSLERSAQTGVLATLPTPIGFRVGCEDPQVRYAVIAAVERELGWINQPGRWDVNLTQTADGWIAEIGPLSWMRRFGQLKRLPWSTTPLVAEVLVRLAKLQPGQRIIDPFCGTGTILLAALRREPTARVLGTDHDPQALAIADRNRQQLCGLVQATAEALPYAAGTVDRIITNLPFGKQVGTHDANRTLYPAALTEIDRVLTADGRAVLLTEDKRLLHKAIEHQKGLKLIRQRLLKYNGATPTAYVLTRPRQRR